MKKRSIIKKAYKLYSEIVNNKKMKSAIIRKIREKDFYYFLENVMTGIEFLKNNKRLISANFASYVISNSLGKGCQVLEIRKDPMFSNSFNLNITHKQGAYGSLSSY